MTVTHERLLALTTAVGTKPFVYYTGAAWNKAGVITDAQTWFTYLQTFRETILSPLVATIN